MTDGLSRRAFLAAAAGGTVSLCLRWLVPRVAVAFDFSGSPGLAGAAASTIDYRGWEDVYRQSFSWDRVVRCTHVVNCWYQRNCSWDVFVRDGIAFREEQAGAYPQVSAGVPDFNPRGCQKGACHTGLMYAPDRLRYPLERVGERGGRRWKRISWDDALSKIADRLIDSVTESGPDSVVLDPGGSLASTAWRLGIRRLVEMLDGVELDTNTELDDGQAGAAVTLGTPVSSRSMDDFFRSDVILIWGGNPTSTQIPNAHFLNEARYHGARIVTIAPDYSASAIHSDLFVPVRPGTDAALALAVARIMLESGRIDEEFIRTQTDLPFLVRADTGRFLRESDLVAGGDDARFYVFDLQTRAPALAPHDTLDWAAVRPALSGSFEIEAKDGRVTVRPVLQMLRERLDRDYTAEKCAAICGLSAAMVRAVAEVIADARALSGVAGSALPKLYHGDLIMRAQLLVFLLGGHIGRPGAGFDTCPMLRLDAQDNAFQSQFDAVSEKMRQAPGFVRKRLEGETYERIVYDLLRDYMDRGTFSSSVLYWRKHAKMAERTDADWGRNLPRSIEEYLAESFANKWQMDPPATPPRVLFVAGSNLIRRLRSSDLLLENLWPKIDLIVNTELRMSTTAMWSDILLPGASSYEKDDVPNWFTLLSPYLHTTQAAVAPLGECKPEWEIHAALARWVQRRARERGVGSFTGRDGNQRRLDNFHDRFTDYGRFGEHDQRALVNSVVENTSFVDGDFESIHETGFRRVNGIGQHPINLGNATDVRADEPVVNRAWRRDNPAPWPTLTRRAQFYIDHPLYLELHEELPVHKEPPRPGGDYPLILTGGHTRWSIHSLWRNSQLLLRLQRGEAAAFVSVEDADSRGITDGSRVRVHNDTGEFVVRARCSHAVRPGTVILYHAWEDYQFAGGLGHRNLLPSPLNPIELAGGYTHLRPVPASLQPGQSDRETRVDIEAV